MKYSTLHSDIKTIPSKSSFPRRYPMKNHMSNAAPGVGIEPIRQLYFLRFPGACLIGLFLLFFLQPAAANGAVLTVTSNGDTIALDASATLREAITSINNQADINNDVTVNRVGLYASQVGGTPEVINFNIPGVEVDDIGSA